MIKFSIIIPSYSNLNLLQNAIGRIISQENMTFEIIVTDDSTTCENYIYINELKCSKLEYHKNSPPLGAVRNWNYGLTLAKGDYIILLHHDEYFIDNRHFLHKCLNAFEYSGSEVLVLNTCVNFRDGTARKQKIPHKIKSFILSHFPSVLFVSNIIGPTSCVVIKRDLVEPFNEKLKWLVDIDWYYRILKNRRITLVNDLFIGSIHGHEGQITNSINIKETESADKFELRNFYGKWSIVSFSLVIRGWAYFVKRKLFKNLNPIWRKS